MCGDKQHMCEGSDCGNTCGGNGCGGHKHGHGHRFMKKVLFFLVIITLTFWMGVQFGQMSGMIRAYKSEGSWNRGGYGMMGQYWGQQNGWAPATTGAAAQTTPEAPAKK